MKYYFTRYLAVYPVALLYMLQDSEYRLSSYFKWLARTKDFRTVMKRRTVDYTPKIKLLRMVLWALWLVTNIAVAVLIVISYLSLNYWYGIAAIILLLILPYILAYGITIPLVLGRIFIQKPQEKKMIEAAREILSHHSAVRIGVAGSYGKTTMKEILKTVLSQGKIVAATPGNMNTAIGISRFAKKLTGKEEVLVIEYGEEHAGDVLELAKLTDPNVGVITGINEAHLVSFKTLETTINTIFGLADYIGDKGKVYKNGESLLVATKVAAHDPYVFSQKGVDGWKVTDAKTSINGTTFTATRDNVTIHAQTKLLGLHTIGVTVAAIAIAHDLGLTKKQIEQGLSNVIPFEHRMEPRNLHDAWIVDDTYNGNSEGVKVGLELLAQLKAKRRIYVTPGLVEQGSKTTSVHETIGAQAAEVADVVVLMQNSVTEHIVKGLEAAGFKGDLLIIDDPLEFYTNLDHFVAAGDVVLMQNDWTDNYQ